MPKLCICTVQIPRVGIIFVHHGGVMPMVKDWCGCFDINIMGIFGWLFLMLKWMIIFVLLQVCLGNAGAKFVRHFIFFVKWSTNQTWELIFCKTNSIFRKIFERTKHGNWFSVKRKAFSVKWFPLNTFSFTRKQFPLKWFYTRKSISVEPKTQNTWIKFWGY